MIQFEALKHRETVLVTRKDLMADMPRPVKVKVIPDVQAYQGEGLLAGIFPHGPGEVKMVCRFAVLPGGFKNCRLAGMKMGYHPFPRLSGTLT